MSDMTLEAGRRPGNTRAAGRRDVGDTGVGWEGGFGTPSTEELERATLARMPARVSTRLGYLPQ